jgi:uncharacterized Zn finger protein
MLTLDNFESEINAQIVQRGRDYFESQAVEFLEETHSGTWMATVEGSEDYEVEVVLSGKKITDQSCDCPYDGGPICKHVVAVLYALREQSANPIKIQEKREKLTFEDLLLKTNVEELRQFVRHHKQQDRDFGEKFMLYFAEKDPRMDVAGKYEGMFRQIVRKNSDRGFMDYRQTHSFSKEIRPLLYAAETALSQKNYRDALVIGKIICTETMQLIQNCDDSAGNIGEILSSGIEVLQGIAEAKTSSPELLEQLLDYLEKTLKDKSWFDYGDYGYELLSVAGAVALKIKPERYLDLLNALAKIHVGEYSNYKQEYFQKSKIQFYEAIGRPDEVEKLIAANMEIVEVRQGEVQKSIQKKDFVRAKQLVKEGIQIAENKKHSGTVSKWEEVLLQIAREEKDLATERHFTKKFALGRGMDIKHYQAWKATYPPSEWESVIEQHIQTVITEEQAKPRLGAWDSLDQVLYNRLASIFIQEEQWERLLQLVSKVPGETNLGNVHPFLSQRYPSEMLDLYLVVLGNLGDKASNRKDYEHIANLMKKLKKEIADSKTAINGLADTLMQKYPRRPAMLEELKKVIGR